MIASLSIMALMGYGTREKNKEPKIRYEKPPNKLLVRYHQPISLGLWNSLGTSLKGGGNGYVYNGHEGLADLHDSKQIYYDKVDDEKWRTVEYLVGPERSRQQIRGVGKPSRFLAPSSNWYKRLLEQQKDFEGIKPILPTELIK